MGWRQEHTEACLEYMRDQLENTGRRVADIAAEVGVSHSYFYELAARYQWKKRRDRPPLDLDPLTRLLAEPESPCPARAAPAVRSPIPGSALEQTNEAEPPAPPAPQPSAAVDPAAPPGAAPQPRSFLERLESALDRELLAVEEMRRRLGTEPHSPVDAERTARTLATLERLLTRLQHLRPSPARDWRLHDDDIPADIDEFRRALARRIEAFIAAEDDAALAEAGDAALADRA